MGTSLNQAIAVTATVPVRRQRQGPGRYARAGVWVALSVASLTSCGDTLGPDDIAAIRISAGNGQTAAAGTEVPVRPAVQAVDDGGQPIAGVSISFTVVEGGGAVSPAVATTDQNGIADVSWTLGPEPGEHVLRASTGRLATQLTFTTTGVVGPAAIIEQQAGDQQTATAGRPVATRPAVRVTDQVGNPVVGVEVTFAVASGGGQIIGASTVTGSTGVATLLEWILGPDPGPNTLTASAEGLTPATFTATGVPGPAIVTIVGGDGQTAVAGTTLPTPPAVLVTDARGKPLSQVAVTFTVVGGGGSVSSGTATTDDAGMAAVQWTLGPLVGTNTLFAQTADLAIVSFTAVGNAGQPALLAIISGDGQAALVGTALPVPPTVVVLDAQGNPVGDVSVEFTVTSGGGSLTGTPAVSNSIGIAAAGWTLGATAGINTVDAVVTGVALVTFFATGLSEVYDIDLSKSGFTPTQRQILTAAAKQWETLVVGDLPPVSFAAAALPANDCGIEHPEVNGTVDDVLIFAVAVDFGDGLGGTLASAGPCVTRDAGGLTVVGVMRFDTADLSSLEQQGLLKDVVLHELGHVLGFGALIWVDLGFLQNPSLNNLGADTHFSGPLAIAAFDAVGGTDYSAGAKVPVENERGSQGTQDSHWRESVLGSELMTGFVDSGQNPLSVVTVESLADLGYLVNSEPADSYTVPLGTASLIQSAAAAGTRLLLKDDVWRGPLYRVDRSGRLTAILRR